MLLNTSGSAFSAGCDIPAPRRKHVTAAHLCFHFTDIPIPYQVFLRSEAVKSTQQLRSYQLTRGQSYTCVAAPGSPRRRRSCCAGCCVVGRDARQRQCSTRRAGLVRPGRQCCPVAGAQCMPGGCPHMWAGGWLHCIAGPCGGRCM